jgi:hypothetical protein
MANKYMKKYSTSLAIKEMQIKTILRFHLTPVGIMVINTQITTDTGKDLGRKETLSTTGRNVN